MSGTGASPLIAIAGGLLHAVDERFHAGDERAGLLRGDGRRDDGRRRWQRMPWQRFDVVLAEAVERLGNFLRITV